jgi:hypothetical protein
LGAILSCQAAKSIAIVLVTVHLNRKSGLAFPSIELLALETGLSRRAVIYGIEALKDRGWLTVSTHKGPKTVNLYKPDFETGGMQKLAILNAEVKKGIEQRRTSRGANSCTSHVQILAPLDMQPLAHKPFEENPLTEPNEGHSRANGAFLPKRHQKLSQSEIRCFQEKVLAIVDNGDVSGDSTFLRLTPLIANGVNFEEEGCLERLEQFADSWEPATEYRELHVFLQSELQLAKRQRPAGKKQTDGLRHPSNPGA